MSLETRTVKGRYGQFTFFAQDQYIGQSLERYGEYSEGEVEIFRRLIKPEDTIIEVGANIGTHTVPLAKMAKRVCAIEAQPENYKLLSENLGNNGCTNVFHWNNAASRMTGKIISIPALEDLGHVNFGGVSVGQGKLDIRTITIDDIVDADAPNKVAFIKIDVEGMEADVIEGARKTIERDHPILYVENDRQEKQAALIELLQGLGYVLYWHLPKLYNLHNHNGNSENIFGDIVSLNMLCLPTTGTQIKGLLSDFDLKYIPNNWEKLKPAARSSENATANLGASSTPSKKKFAGVCRLGGVGDDLVAASVCRPLKAQGYMVEFIAQDPYHVILENNPFIDRLVVKQPEDLGKFPDITAWQRWFANRAKEYDLFVNLSHSMEGQLALFPALTAAYWPPHARHMLCDKSYLEFAHDIVGVPHTFGPLFFPTDREKEVAQQKKLQASQALGGGRPVIAWVLSGTRLDKIYPAGGITVARIIRELGAVVVMVGAPKDFAMAQSIQEIVRVQNSTDEGLWNAMTNASATPEQVAANPALASWPIRKSLAFVQACDVVVAPDTGPAWAVATEDMPKIVLTSHASPRNIITHWRNTIALHGDPKRVKCPRQGEFVACHLLHDAPDTCWPNETNTGAACISDISVECLVTAVRSALGDAAASKHLMTRWPTNVTTAQALGGSGTSWI